MPTLMRRLLNRRTSAVVVQNPDDLNEVLRIGVKRERVTLIRGSGVDTSHFTVLPEPRGEIVTAYTGRLIAAKGIDTLVDAHGSLARSGHPVRLLIAGERDPGSRDAIAETTVNRWRSLPFVEMLGHINDVREVWARAHIAVLASEREGLPMSLLEAASCGRPIVSTDVPGSREIARDGVNAITVPAGDTTAFAAAVASLANDPALRRQYGAQSRRLAVAEFSAESVGHQIVGLYRRLLDGAA